MCINLYSNILIGFEDIWVNKSVNISAKTRVLCPKHSGINLSHIYSAYTHLDAWVTSTRMSKLSTPKDAFYIPRGGNRQIKRGDRQWILNIKS